MTEISRTCILKPNDKQERWFSGEDHCLNREVPPVELTKQNSWEHTETEAATAETLWICASSSPYMLCYWVGSFVGLLTAGIGGSLTFTCSWDSSSYWVASSSSDMRVCAQSSCILLGYVCGPVLTYLFFEGKQKRS